MPTKSQVVVDMDYVKEHMLGKGLRESSTKTYINRIRLILKRIFDGQPLTKTLLAKNKKKILDFIVQDTTSANNRKVAVQSLSHLLSTYDIDTQYLYPALKDLHQQSDADYIANNSKKVVDKINQIDFDKIKSNIETFKNPHDRLIAACYSLLPPLRQQDWTNVPVLTSTPKEPINHINLKKKQLIIHEHKTSRAHGTKTINIPTQLINEIKRYIADPAKNNILLPFSSSNMSRRINIVWGASTQMLRKAYVSKYAPKMNSDELIMLSKIMGHNLSTEILCYRKNLQCASELQQESIPDSASECSVESQDASTQT